MAMTRKRRILIAASAVVGILFVFWRSFSNPLRGTETQIREWLLQQTPLGEQEEASLRTLRARGWKPFSYGIWDVTKGRVYTVEIGEYQGVPWWVTVRAAWTFDENGRLVDVLAEKQFDSP